MMHGRFSVCCSEGPVKTVRPIGSAPARAATQSTPTAIAPRTATRRIRFIVLCFLRTSAGPQHWGLRARAAPARPARVLPYYFSACTKLRGLDNSDRGFLEGRGLGRLPEIAITRLT